MVIFGAGASFDSDRRHRPTSADVLSRRDTGYRPPLAAQLFQDRFAGFAQQYNPSLALISRLRRVAEAEGAPVEMELERIQGETEIYPLRIQQLLAIRYYLDALIDWCTGAWTTEATKGATNYADLLDRIGRWRHSSAERVCFVTFNYDTLLDSACWDALGLTFTSMDDYIGDSSYTLLKPHGSIGWLHQAGKVGTLLSGNLSRFPFFAESGPQPEPQDLTWTDEYDLAPPPSEGRPRRQAGPGSAWIPAIAIPTVDKTAFEFPREHQDALVAAIPEVTHLLIVGWRGSEKHFLKLWYDEQVGEHKSARAGKLERMLIVDASHQTAKAVEATLSEDGLIRATHNLRAEGFSNFLDTSQLEEFLGD